LGDDFLAEFAVVQARVEKNPRVHQVIWQNVRRALFHRFPYGMFYQVLPDRVEVLAIHHLKRDPKGWQQRA
jgi:toxin ParE1/3/4